jgi:hypothetical protein
MGLSSFARKGRPSGAAQPPRLASKNVQAARLGISVPLELGLTRRSKMATKELQVSEVSRLLEELEQVHEGGAWHGPSVREAVDGVSAAGAVKRPIAGGHSIWEIVHHVRVNEAAVRAHMAGETAGDEADWPSPGDSGEAAWRAELSRLETTERALREAVSKLAASRLHENIPGKSHSYWHELVGIMHHDLYHAGQISLLKKAL